MRFPFMRRRRAVSAAERYATATQLQLTWWRFRRHRLAMVSLVLLVLAYGMAIMADFLTTMDPHDTNAATSYIAPQPIHWFDSGAFRPYVYGLKGVRDLRTFKLIYTVDTSRKVYVEFMAHNYRWSILGFSSDRHLFGLRDPRRGDGIYLLGTDQLGRDVFARLLYGLRTDLKIACIAVLFPFCIGTVLGGIAGYYGGWVDTVIMRLVDIVVAFPFYVLIIALVFVLGPGERSIYIAITLVGWVSYARIVRGEILVAKRQDYVLAAQSGGLAAIRIIGRHLLPNVITQAIIYAMSDIVQDMLAIVTLGYFGLGVPPPTPDLGSMINDGQNFLTTHWQLTTFPGLVVVVVGLALSLIGDGLADLIRPGQA